jgi:hypothetical protein
MEYKTIIIANIAEAFEDALSLVAPESERIKKVQIEHNYATELYCGRVMIK